MSAMRVTGPQTPVITEPQARSAAKPKAQVASSEAPERSIPASLVKESFISSLAASRQPPKMALGNLMSQGPTALFKMFSSELDTLERRSMEEVAGDLAMTYLALSKTAQDQGDGDLIEAFDELGNLMKGYEHLRMLKTGELG